VMVENLQSLYLDLYSRTRRGCRAAAA
jgi:hypothetical protein